MDVMNARKVKFGLDHPDTLHSMANLACIYWYQGKLDEAYSLLSLAVQAMQQILGTSHPTVVHYIKQLNILSKAKQEKERQQVVQSQSVCKRLFFNDTVNPFSS